jgi:hypothetical protein
VCPDFFVIRVFRLRLGTNRGPKMRTARANGASEQGGRHADRPCQCVRKLIGNRARLAGGPKERAQNGFGNRCARWACGRSGLPIQAGRLGLALPSEALPQSASIVERSPPVRGLERAWGTRFGPFCAGPVTDSSSGRPRHPLARTCGGRGVWRGARGLGSDMPSRILIAFAVRVPPALPWEGFVRSRR